MPQREYEVWRRHYWAERNEAKFHHHSPPDEITGQQRGERGEDRGGAGDSFGTVSWRLTLQYFQQRGCLLLKCLRRAHKFPRCPRETAQRTEFRGGEVHPNAAGGFGTIRRGALPRRLLAADVCRATRSRPW